MHCVQTHHRLYCDKKLGKMFKYTLNVAFSVCTLAINADNSIVQSNGAHKEYLQLLNVMCKPGYKLSNDSDNSETNTTLNCLESGEFEPPPVCVKKGNNYTSVFPSVRPSVCPSFRPSV